ncbi:MAG: hypothetical protein IPJ88_04765 [Myxococcales bacterium]|nr:MAG: hypothetical protein IPJ88_04765 [Myxococcales bacterium]
MLATIGAIGLAQGTTCATRGQLTGACLEEDKPRNAIAWAEVGLGAASITAGIVWFFLGQYQTRAPTETQSSNDIQVKLSPTSIELRGTF